MNAQQHVEMRGYNQSQLEAGLISVPFAKDELKEELAGL